MFSAGRKCFLGTLLDDFSYYDWCSKRLFLRTRPVISRDATDHASRFSSLCSRCVLAAYLIDYRQILSFILHDMDLGLT